MYCWTISLLDDDGHTNNITVLVFVFDVLSTVIFAPQTELMRSFAGYFFNLLSYGNEE